MADIHLHEIYSSLVTDDMAKDDPGNRILWVIYLILENTEPEG